MLHSVSECNARDAGGQTPQEDWTKALGGALFDPVGVAFLMGSFTQGAPFGGLRATPGLRCGTALRYDGTASAEGRESRVEGRKKTALADFRELSRVESVTHGNKEGGWRAIHQCAQLFSASEARTRWRCGPVGRGMIWMACLGRRRRLVATDCSTPLGLHTWRGC
jgi:hypothetical protein